MNKKLVKEFLIITSTIMTLFWGGCALISQIFNVSVNNIFLIFYLFFTKTCKMSILKNSHFIRG